LRAPLTVTIQGARGDEWERVCGTRTFPVINWEPIMATLPGRPGKSAVWIVNLLLLDEETRGKIVTHLAAKFGEPREQVRRDIDAQGIPILAEEAFVVLNDVQRWVG
jgi:hypothetical protein